MCGIVGGISLKNKFDFADEIGRMNTAIAHRGPDSDGIYLNELGTVCFGHRRLAILDLSELGHQPMQIGEYVICYNGEVYNYVELRAELAAQGIKFVSNTDTEVNFRIVWLGFWPSCQDQGIFNRTFTDLMP